MTMPARHQPAAYNDAPDRITATQYTDTAPCPHCRREIFDPTSRRYRYPLTSCANCGPRYSISRAQPGTREHTTMQTFALCPACDREFNRPGQRCFHAPALACHDCGPQVRLERHDGKTFCLTSLTQLDAVDAACTVLQNGGILAIQGIGGFELACDASREDSVARLRRAKQSAARPLALMARDIDSIQRYARVSEQEAVLLNSREAPVVILQKRAVTPAGRQRSFGTAKGFRHQDMQPLAQAVAPGLNTLAFMLPASTLHHLLLKRMNRPIVITSANRSGALRCVDHDEIREHFGEVDYILWHDQHVLNRIDESLCRIIHRRARVLRHARGHAPAALPLPPGFEKAPAILATGAEQNNSFCLLAADRLIVSHQHGDLQQPEQYANYQLSLCRYLELFHHRPERLAVDALTGHAGSRFGRQFAQQQSLPLTGVSYHHAHIAACLAENRYPRDGEAVLGVVLDAPHAGDDGSLWGGEFLLADYQQCTRLATFKPVGTVDADDAHRLPWHDCYTQLLAEMNWAQLKINYGELELIRFFEQHTGATARAPKATLTTSSCSRLMEAVAAALDICRDEISYPQQAMQALEAMVDHDTLENEDPILAYPFAIPLLHNSMPYIEPLAMWQALLGDLILDTPRPVMAARFHKGLANAIVRMVDKLCHRDDQRVINTVAISGSACHNRILLELVLGQLEYKHYRVLTHARLPANGACVAAGQAMVAAAQQLAEAPVANHQTTEEVM